MFTILACGLLGAVITDGPPPLPAQVVPPSTCDSRLTIRKGASLLDVTGVLNGYPLALDKKSVPPPAPGGAIDVKLFGVAGCPTSEDQLVEPFTFTAESRGSLTIDPQAGFTVMAGRVIRFVVKDLQIKVTTPAPIAVNEASFDSAEGVHMEITSGTAAALGRTISLVGRTAAFPLGGYFSLTDGGALALSITSSSATFAMDTQLGSTTVSGEVTLSGALEAAASVAAHALVADAVHGRLLSGVDEVGGLTLAGATRADRPRVEGAIVLVGLVAVLAAAFVAARPKRWRLRAGPPDARERMIATTASRCPSEEDVEAGPSSLARM